MAQKEYLKMADVFHSSCIAPIAMDDELYCGDDFIAEFTSRKIAHYAAHAISSHDELVAEVERLRKSLSWAVDNLPFEHSYEWSDDENADAHHASIKLLGIEE